jgi:hypothetical protein
MISDTERGWVRQHLACLDLDPPIRRQIHSLLKVDRVGMAYPPCHVVFQAVT